MNTNGAKPAKPPRRSPARSLGEACRELGYDEAGRRCEGCPLAGLCQSEERWLVSRLPPSGYLS